MKILHKALIILVILLSTVQSQNQSNARLIQLEMPEGSSKIGILIEHITGEQDILTPNQILSHVKLNLRSNRIDYFANIDDKTNAHGYLYVSVTIKRIGDLGIYGNVNVQFKRGQLHQISFDKRASDLINSNYLYEKGRKAIYSATVWQQSGTYFYPSKYTYSVEIKNYIGEFVDLFSSDYIDANEL